MSRIVALIFLVATITGYPTQTKAETIQNVSLACPGCSSAFQLSSLGERFLQEWQFNTPPGYPEGSYIEPWFICYNGAWPLGDCTQYGTGPTYIYVYSDTYAISGIVLWNSNADDRMDLFWSVVNTDADLDGIEDRNDNCRNVPNRGQLDCDDDRIGDACDGENGRYVTAGPEQTCMIDRDTHVFTYELEHRVEWLERDTSSCRAPDRWSARIRASTECALTTNILSCCGNLRTSIIATGADLTLWCTARLDQNFCH